MFIANLISFVKTFVLRLNATTAAGNFFTKYKEDVIKNIENNLEDSLILMLTGMVGIFVVMIVLMILIFLLNKFTQDKKDKDDKDK